MHSYKKCILTIILVAVQVSYYHKVLAEGAPCSNAVNSATGTCVNALQCAPYKAMLLTHGAQASDLLRDSLCYYTRDYPIVCCPTTAAPALQSSTAPAPHWAYAAASAVQSAAAVGSAQQWASAAPISAPPAPQLAAAAAFGVTRPSMYGPLFAPHCGFSRATHYRSVSLDGYPADLHAYRWLAALGYQSHSEKPFKWMCGGSLISTRHVLTSARCVYGRSDLKVVRLGDHDLNDDEDGAYPIDVPIERFTVHPNFKSGVDILADIAVIRLQRDITFSDDIQPICLPLPDNIRYKNYTGFHPFLAGWGSLHAEGVPRHSLSEYWYPVLSTDQCRKALTKGFKIQGIDEQILCTGYLHGEINVCLTDKGAPLMYPKDGSFYAIGVLSSSIGCERNRYPHVYTRVSQYLDFIFDHMY